VPSAALVRWNASTQRALDQVRTAHRAVGGRFRGRRSATLQLNHAYVLILSSQFQGFCRDLCSEAAQVIARNVPLGVQEIVASSLTQGRKLDHGNPSPANLQQDFLRLGLDLWRAVHAQDRRNVRRQRSIEELNAWRNAIAHQDWRRLGPGLRLPTVEAWRSACHALAPHFDRAVFDRLCVAVGRAPW
jgi:hypothetical protein